MLQQGSHLGFRIWLGWIFLVLGPVFFLELQADFVLVKERHYAHHHVVHSLGRIVAVFKVTLVQEHIVAIKLVEVFLVRATCGEDREVALLARDASERALTKPQSVEILFNGLGEDDTVGRHGFDDFDSCCLCFERQLFPPRRVSCIRRVAPGKSEAALAVLRVAQVVGSLNLRLEPIDQRDARLDPSVPVHSRGKIWVFPVESRSNHYFHSVHTRFSFQIILSGQEKQAGSFAKR